MRRPLWKVGLFLPFYLLGILGQGLVSVTEWVERRIDQL